MASGRKGREVSSVPFPRGGGPTDEKPKVIGCGSEGVDSETVVRKLQRTFKLRGSQVFYFSTDKEELLARKGLRESGLAKEKTGLVG